MVFLSSLIALGVGQLGMPSTGLGPSVSNVQFGVLGSGDDATSGAAGIYLFNDPNGWVNYWNNNHRGPGPTLSPDFFMHWRLVAIHAGTRPTDGYSLGVRQIVRRNAARATINALELTPARGNRTRPRATSPWIVLRVERGAYDFDLNTQRFAVNSGAQTLQPGQQVKMGGATVTFGPGGYVPPK